MKDGWEVRSRGRWQRSRSGGNRRMRKEGRKAEQELDSLATTSTDCRLSRRRRNKQRHSTRLLVAGTHGLHAVVASLHKGLRSATSLLPWPLLDKCVCVCMCADLHSMRMFMMGLGVFCVVLCCAARFARARGSAALIRCSFVHLPCARRSDLPRTPACRTQTTSSCDHCWHRLYV
jgi:hypothetical protein